MGRRGVAAVTVVLVPPGSARAGARCLLDDDEAHHLRVRRTAPGEIVALRDGIGLLGTGTLEPAGRGWAVAVERVDRAPRPAELILAVAAGDRERFEWLLEKAAELGATRVVPLETERTPGVATRLQPRHLDKARRRALGVVKQSGAAWSIAVDDFTPLIEFVGRRDDGLRWLADRDGSAPPEGIDGDPVTVVVGPEGGLTERERRALAGAGYHPVRLAAHTLRFETAAVSAAAVVGAARLRRTDG